MTVFNITANSQPVYDTWGFGDYWSCADWMKWFTELRKVYKKDESEYIWSKAWLDGVSIVSGGTGTASGSNYITDSVPLDCRTFDANFKNFLNQNTNLKSAVFSGIGGLIAKPVGLTVDVINGVVSVVGSGVTTITTTATIAKYAIPTVIVVLVIFLLIFTYKYSVKKIDAL